MAEGPAGIRAGICFGATGDEFLQQSLAAEEDSPGLTPSAVGIVGMKDKWVREQGVGGRQGG